MSVNCCIKSVVLGQEKNIVLYKSYVQYGFSFLRYRSERKFCEFCFACTRKFSVTDDKSSTESHLLPRKRGNIKIYLNELEAQN